MKKLKRAVFTILAIFLLLPMTMYAQGERNLFVAPNGNDLAGNGSKNHPFASIDRARDEIRILKSANSHPESYHVNIREGVYYRNSTFRLLVDDSGEKDFPVVYSAYKNEKVVVNGGVNIPLWEIHPVSDKLVLKRFAPEVRPHIMEVDLKAAGINNYGTLRPVGFARPYGPAWAELFVNDQPFTLSRWPNDSTVKMGKIIDAGSVPRNGDYSNRGGKFTFDTNRPLRWKSHDDIWISGYFRYGYAEDAVELSGIDTVNKIFETKQPTLYGFGTGNNFNRWFVYNVLEEIDKPGEFYIDRKAGKLYFYPAGKVDELALSMLETPLISLIGASNVHIGGITFECSRGMGVYMEQTQNNRIENCTFKNLGIVAVCMGKGIKPFENLMHEGDGKPASEVLGSIAQHLYKNTTFNSEAGSNNGIVNCTVYNMGAGGIRLSGGDRLTLTPANNFVENCIIHDFNRIEKSYRAGIDISGVGNRISHCEIYNAPSMAILLHGNDHLIEYNEIHDVCKEVDDQGALYYGRDPSERGNKVFYNFFHHLNNPHRTTAVYQDDGACGTEVFGNVFYKPGKMPVLIGGGSDNHYVNNIFIDADLGIHVDNRMQNWSKGTMAKGGLFEERLNAVHYNQPPYSIRYPELAKYWDDNPALPKRNIISKNIFYHVKKIYTGKREWMPFLDDNWVTNENPGFVDESKMNFKLKSNAKAFKQIPEFKDIPFEKIGVQRKRVK